MADLLAHERTSPPPVGVPRSWALLVVPAVVAGVIGVVTGLEAWTMLVVALGAGLGAVLLVRLEWAVLVVVAASVFEDYLVLVTPWASKGLAVVLMASWLIRRSWGRLHDGPRSAVVLAALGFFVVLLLATVVHNNGRPGADIVIRYVGFLAVLAVLVDTMRGGLAPERVARVYVWACAAASVCGLVAFANGVDRRVVGPIADANDLAFFLVAAVPLALVLRARSSRSWLYDFALVLTLAAILGTLSRGALVGLGAMLVVAVVVRIITLRTAALILVPVVTAGAILVGAFSDLIEVSLERKAAVADQNVSERLDLWNAAGAMARDSPLIGQGPGSYSLYHQDYVEELPVDVTHRLDVAHNTYLEVLAELGMLGLLALLVLLLIALWSAWARWRRTGDRLAAGVFVALIGTAVTATFV
ncbi:MAG TPA: O-antigen ligase family protein, partial [Nocardioides sp.]|nr:O-antigen ligase family protein [Nocardioides sp.]